MTATGELQLLAGFGRALDDARLVAVQRTEWTTTSRHRTFLLQVQGVSARIVETVPRPIAAAWRSDSGTVYCPTDAGVVLTWSDGEQRSIQVCDRDERFGAIHGIAGATPSEDRIVVAGRTSLFIGSDHTWAEHRFPDPVTEIWGIHGPTHAEVHVCTDAGLYLWNGTNLSQIEGPDDEILDILVLHDQKIAVGERVHRWREGSGWTELASPATTHARGLCHIDDRVFVPSRDGIFEVGLHELRRVFELASNRLVALGGCIVGAGNRGGACCFDGRTWSRLMLPAIEPLVIE